MALTATLHTFTIQLANLDRGSKLAGRAAIYTHRDARQLLSQYADAKIHRAEQIPLHAFARDFVSEASGRLQRRSTLAVSFTEGQLYLDLDGHAMTTTVE